MTDIKDNAIIKKLLAHFAVKVAALDELIERYLNDKLPVPATSLLAFVKMVISDADKELKSMLLTNIVFDSAVEMAVKQFQEFLLKKEDKETLKDDKILH